MSLKPAFWDTVLASAPQVPGTFATGPLARPNYASFVMVLIGVSAVSGTTKTLDVVIQTSPDGSTWTTVATATQMTAIGGQVLTAAVLDHYVQAVATVAGSGSPIVTFSLGALVLGG